MFSSPAAGAGVWGGVGGWEGRRGVVERYRRVGVFFEVEGRVEVEVRVAAAGTRRAPDGVDDGTMPADTAARNLGTRRMLVCKRDNSMGGVLRLACSNAAAANK